MSSNPFILDESLYKQDVNPVGHYVEHASFYLSTVTGKSIEQCREYVLRVLKDKTFPDVLDPKVTFLERQPNGDREEKESTLNVYIKEAIQAEDIIAPTLTTYINPRVKESIYVNYVDDNKRFRGIAKRAEFAATAAGDIVLAQFKNTEQTNRKLSNNAISGAHVSASTPLYNKTAHSTLTSTCRTTSGYGNANNEKIIAGNRHYWSGNIVINSIVSITKNANYEELEAIVEKYNLKLPSRQDVMDCITFSTKLYGSSEYELKDIKILVEKLSPLQRAAFVYIGDMYHLMLHNDSFMRNFLYELSLRVEEKCDDALKKIKEIPEDILILAHQLCASKMKGKGKDYKKIEHTQELQTLVSTSFNIIRVINKYKDLIKALWVTKNVPSSVAYFPESIRRIAITSDTDSTIFTVQDWVHWYKGAYSFDDESMRIAATMIFLASQTITHVLALMSANFGVRGKRLFEIAMKSEFKFDVFIPSQVAKHYMAIISAQEGNIYSENKTEIKGVHLKSSNAPKVVTKRATDLMNEIMDSILAGKKINLGKTLKTIADVEREITNSINNGGTEYFRLAQIKTADSYSEEPEVSLFMQFTLWETIFAPKYGTAPPLPYETMKIPLTIVNGTKVKNWLTNIADKELAERFGKWFRTTGRKVLPTIYIPTELDILPDEIRNIIDTRRTVEDLCNVFYIILEMLGYYRQENDLISDLY